MDGENHSMMAIAIPDAVREAVEHHANAVFPAECCGYLVGPVNGTTVDAVIACRNAQGDGEHPTVPERGVETGFVIAGEELFAFARSFDSQRPARIVYHSHPNGRAYFSDIDRDVARSAGYPVQHLVVGVTAAGVTELAQFAWSDEFGDFVEVFRWLPRCYASPIEGPIL